MPTANAYYNEMFDRQAVFSQFLIDFRTTYTFAVMPEMSEIIVSMDREDLITSQQSNLRSLQTSWNDYKNWTDTTIELLRDGNVSESDDARKTATDHLEAMMDDLENLIGDTTEAAELMDEHAEATIREGISYLIASGSAVGILVAVITLYVSS
ncbi:TPA: hypothetical protein HA259_00995, partial [Thermoplasmata archaeon]|nr:hypothetical protein [Thermoplasmata archaeon]